MRQTQKTRRRALELSGAARSRRQMKRARNWHRGYWVTAIAGSVGTLPVTGFIADSLTASDQNFSVAFVLIYLVFLAAIWLPLPFLRRRLLNVQESYIDKELSADQVEVKLRANARAGTDPSAGLTVAGQGGHDIQGTLAISDEGQLTAHDDEVDEAG